MSPQGGGEERGAAPPGWQPRCAAERAAEAPPLPAVVRTPGQSRRRGRGERRLGPPPSRSPAPRLRRPGCCQLPPAETWCMLSRCGRRLLQVLGLSFPLLTRRPLILCPHRLMKPLVVFVLGGPGAGKGTQCTRIVEVRLGQLAGYVGLTGRRASLSRSTQSSAPPGSADYESRQPLRRPLSGSGGSPGARHFGAGSPRCSPRGRGEWKGTA